MEELIEAFSLERVGKSGSKFDPEKAKWYNQQYLRTRDDAELADIFLVKLKEEGIDAVKAYVTAVCSLIKEKTQFTSEFWDFGSYFFQKPVEFDEQVIAKRWNENAVRFFPVLADDLSGLASWKTDVIETTFKATAEKLEINPGHVMQLFRVLLSGQGGGPVLFEMTELLGQEEVVARLREGVEKLK